MIAKSLIGEDLFTSEWESARRQIVARRSERKRNLDQKERGRHFNWDLEGLSISWILKNSFMR